MIAASGTGGHLFPALAVADALPSDWSVRWLGVPDRLERELVPSRYPLHTVRAGGLQGRGLRKLCQLLRLLLASRDVRRLIRRERIQLVFSTGGYIAAPVILAALPGCRPGSPVGEVTGRVTIDVIDNGSGIAKESQGLIFEKFARLTDANRAGGAGLGLAICRRLCALLGGTESVRSTLGRGSAFTLRLPRA